MFKIKQMVWVLGCASVLGGCASWYRGDDRLALDIKPVMNVQHAGSSREGMYRLGRYYQGMGRYQQAIAAYEKALAADPGYIEAYNELGVIHSLQGRHDLARQQFKMAIGLAPMATYLHNNLGYSYLVQGRESEAAESFRQALQLDPQNQRARRNLATAYERVGLHDEAAVLMLAVATAAQTATAPPPAPAMPAIVTAAVDEESQIPRNNAADGQHNAEARLVQVAPSVYEYRMAERDIIMTALTEPAITTATPGTTGATTGVAVRNGKTVRIEVSNGNGVTGMARYVAGFLQRSGLSGASRLTNHQTFQQAQTEIYYRPGNQAQADRISRMLPQQARAAKVIESSNLRADIQVRILLGKDVAHAAAYFNNKDQTQVARNSRSVIAGQ